MSLEKLFKWPLEHRFNYANSKFTFDQGIGCLCLDMKKRRHTVFKKEKMEDVLCFFKKRHVTYRKPFKDKIIIVKENGKETICKVSVECAPNGLYSVTAKKVIFIDDLFNILCELHMCNPYLNKNEIISYLDNCLVYGMFIKLFWESCDTCRNVIFFESNYKFKTEVAIFSMDTPDGNFTRVFAYVDKNTNYVILRPINRLSYQEIAYELLTRLCDFGIPNLLFINNNKKLFENVLKVLGSIDLPFRIPTTSSDETMTYQVKAIIKKAKRLLLEWMQENNSKNWATGIHIVQWMMNTSGNTTCIKSKTVKGPIHSPYHALFGVLPHKAMVKDNPHTDPKKSDEILIDCTQCKLPIYKVFNCHFCQQPYHFSCCSRYVVEAIKGWIFVNKCYSCANNSSCPIEEVILGT